jgi:hypothetical protein
LQTAELGFQQNVFWHTQVHMLQQQTPTRACCGVCLLLLIIARLHSQRHILSKGPLQAAPQPISASPQLRMQVAEDLLATFKPAQCTLDAHLDAALAARPISHSDAAFVRQLVYGTTRYSALLATFKAAFYHHRGGSALRKDAPLYGLLTYLAVIRIDELGAAAFGELLVTALDAQKVAVWLGFAFDKAHLRGELREEWAKVYDKAWVDGRIGALQTSPRGTRLIGGRSCLEHRLWRNVQQNTTWPVAVECVSRVFIWGACQRLVTRKYSPVSTCCALSTALRCADALLAAGRQLAPTINTIAARASSATASASSAAAHSPSHAKPARKQTVPEPFQLSESAPKPLPDEEAAPPKPQAKPPPPRRAGPTREEAAIAAARCVLVCLEHLNCVAAHRRVRGA